jgi:hypothetical protein
VLDVSTSRREGSLPALALVAAEARANWVEPDWRHVFVPL